jgi:hypothetical protein
MKKNTFKFVYVFLSTVAMMALSRVAKAETCAACDATESQCTTNCSNYCYSYYHNNFQSCMNACTNGCLDAFDACYATCTDS